MADQNHARDINGWFFPVAIRIQVSGDIQPFVVGSVQCLGKGKVQDITCQKISRHAMHRSGVERRNEVAPG